MAAKSRRSTYALALVLVWSGACAREQARVSVAFYPRPPLTADMIRVRVADGDRIYDLAPADFRSERGGALYRSRALATRRSGTLRVSFALTPTPVDTASSGTVELPLRSDWRYEVDVMPDTTTPARGCFGCAGWRAFGLAIPYAGPTADSVYVIWGGNAIKRPGVY